MIKLTGEPGEVRFTVTIVRKGTGKVETYDMVGHADPDKLAAIIKSPADDADNQPKEQ